MMVIAVPEQPFSPLAFPSRLSWEGDLYLELSPLPNSPVQTSALSELSPRPQSPFVGPSQGPHLTTISDALGHLEPQRPHLSRSHSTQFRPLYSLMSPAPSSSCPLPLPCLEPCRPCSLLASCLSTAQHPQRNPPPAKPWHVTPLPAACFLAQTFKALHGPE